MTDFAENLRAFLDKKGWRQTEAAERFGVSQANVNRWLNGHHQPSIEQILRVARTLGVTVDVLLRAPGPTMATRKAGRPHGADPEFPRWFRQLRLTWRRGAEHQEKIRVGLGLVWPNQALQIIAWLEKNH